jgi:hypothetical protein
MLAGRTGRLVTIGEQRRAMVTAVAGSGSAGRSNPSSARPRSDLDVHFTRHF